MKTTFYLDGKKTTKKAVKELIGEERLKRIIEEAKETFFEDPLVQNDFFIGTGMLTIEFALDHAGRQGQGAGKPAFCRCLSVTQLYCTQFFTVSFVCIILPDPLAIFWD